MKMTPYGVMLGGHSPPSDQTKPRKWKKYFENFPRILEILGLEIYQTALSVYQQTEEVITEAEKQEFLDKQGEALRIERKHLQYHVCDPPGAPRIAASHGSRRVNPAKQPNPDSKDEADSLAPDDNNKLQHDTVGSEREAPIASRTRASTGRPAGLGLAALFTPNTGNPQDQEDDLAIRELSLTE